MVRRNLCRGFIFWRTRVVPKLSFTCAFDDWRDLAVLRPKNSRADRDTNLEAFRRPSRAVGLQRVVSVNVSRDSWHSAHFRNARSTPSCSASFSALYTAGFTASRRTDRQDMQSGRRSLVCKHSRARARMSRSFNASALWSQNARRRTVISWLGRRSNYERA